ncbi:tRNA (adenosine(37)-N6)-dimethylallyltransferase MiaA [Roseinatronobacter sp. S2]|uniref:tRNA (adenosine(37)-N6)-dimethylallyltransferase MiaA n=1 Tax=Roseinatronobacter sp. S2 TaxID=3035471 RepID=UPI00240EE1B1|nr:tRNA (adenosine(37)-N6)-dimethylallyltransferase MiaA [Roseinatronobacter sp. S2]WFE74449.1 tRNA (adenosine(37)-N6)-dimethylallyltransferase MiaA [Roseinatronobacter sp. S2]
MTDPSRDALLKLQAQPPDVTRPVLLAGPTASGKSALALWLACTQGRVVINADALQVYDMWHTLSARPDAHEIAQAPHFLYGCVSRGQDWSVGHWLRAVQPLLARHPNPVIVGGTGLYFRALTEGLVEIPPTPAEIRAQADRHLAENGADALLAELDPATAARIDTANPARIQRAWEVLRTTGRGLADWQDDTPPPLLFLHNTTPYVLRPPKDWLNARIDSRFEQMIAAGALDEARAVLPHWTPGAPWTKAIGAPELIAHLQDQISLSDAIDAAKLATRQYAKRQRTWFRNRMQGWISLP